MNRIFLKQWFSATLFFFIFVFLLPDLSGQKRVTDSLTADLLQDIQQTAQHDRLGAQRWWYGWLAGYSAATAVQGGISLTTENRNLRQDMALGAATTFLGAVGQLLTPMVPREFSKGASLNVDQSAELLKALALREKEGRSWKVHAIAGAVNLGSGLITWLGFKRTLLDGVENFAINTVITEAQIWTQPTRAIKDYQNYCRTQSQREYPAALKPESKWTVNVYPGGFDIRLDF
ncbi:MAG: hypothetical protein E4G92_05185 [Bacteroidia bacterium]|nr:MAG: hypothetical protein E4G92_05185 [Bacteroidia bacterium]